MNMSSQKDPVGLRTGKSKARVTWRFMPCRVPKKRGGGRRSIWGQRAGVYEERQRGEPWQPRGTALRTASVWCADPPGTKETDLGKSMKTNSSTRSPGSPQSAASATSTRKGVVRRPCPLARGISAASTEANNAQGYASSRERKHRKQPMAPERSWTFYQYTGPRLRQDPAEQAAEASLYTGVDQRTPALVGRQTCAVSPVTSLALLAATRDCTA